MLDSISSGRSSLMVMGRISHTLIPRYTSSTCFGILLITFIIVLDRSLSPLLSAGNWPICKQFNCFRFLFLLIKSQDQDIRVFGLILGTLRNSKTKSYTKQGSDKSLLMQTHVSCYYQFLSNQDIFYKYHT